MAVERAERPTADPERERAHGLALQQGIQRRQRSLDPLALVVGEEGESRREPRRAPGAHPLEERLPFGRQLEADAPPVVRRADAAQQPGGFEAIDVPRERGRGDALFVRELSQREARVVSHEPEEGDLVRGDAERLGLAAQVAREPQEGRPELLGELERGKRSFTNHS